MKNQKISSRIILLLQVLTFSIFIGRAYQFIFFDIPFRSLFWDEKLMTPIVQFWGLSWNAYITDLKIAQNQEIIIQIIGFFLFFLSIVVFFIQAYQKWLNPLLIFGSLILFCLSLLYWKEHFYHIGQLIEYSIQWTVPILMILFIKSQNQAVEKMATFIFITKMVIALTFIGHGLYAFGIYPVSGNFVQMCLDIFPLDDFQAKYFLKTIGFLDFTAAIFLFIPKVEKIGIWYCIIWGLLTAWARIVANFDINIPWVSLHQWLWETIIRLSHGGIPLVLLCSLKLK